MAMQAGGKTMWADEGAYPVRERLGNANDDEVLVVDIGGGAGHDLLGFRVRHPDLKGRLVLQEMPYMVEKVKGEGACEGVVELMGHDFCGSQPVKGAFRVAISCRGKRRKIRIGEPANTWYYRSSQLFFSPNPTRLFGRNLPPNSAADHSRDESRNVQDPDQRTRFARSRSELGDDFARYGGDDLLGGEGADGEGVPRIV